jgi:uncharacterized DUF497 family protein
MERIAKFFDSARGGWELNIYPVGKTQFAERRIYAMIDMVFEWDSEKERDNVREHGVNISDASEIFYDYFREEDRWQTMGFYNDVIFVVYTERGDVTRIISARVAEPFERRIYYGDSEIHGWQRVNP